MRLRYKKDSRVRTSYQRDVRAFAISFVPVRTAPREGEKVMGTKEAHSLEESSDTDYDEDSNVCN
jgi:hypothetical protein